MPKRIFRFIKKEIIHGGHFQTLGSISIVLSSVLLFNLKLTWDCLLVVYLFTYPSYLFNRFKEINIDSLTNPERTEHLKKYIKFVPLILISISLILFISLVYFTNFNFKAIVLTLIIFILGLLYTTTFKKATRKIPFFKNFYVSLVFSLMVFYPIIYYSYRLTDPLIKSLLIFSIFVYLKTLMMQIFLDLKDVKSDKSQRFITLPVLLKEKKTLKLLKISNILITFLVPFIFSSYLKLFPKSILMLVFLIPFDLYCYNLVNKKNFIYILQSGEFILWPILIIIGKILL